MKSDTRDCGSIASHAVGARLALRGPVQARQTLHSRAFNRKQGGQTPILQENNVIMGQKVLVKR